MNKGLNPTMDFGCMLCRFDTSTEYYMVHHYLWRIAIEGLPTTGRFLCIGCIEKQLGRKLIAADFMKVPCNDHREWYKNSDRILNRLAA